MNQQGVISPKSGTFAQPDVQQRQTLSSLERYLLIIPALAGLFFGIMPLFFPSVLASIAGTPGNDLFAYRLAGAASLGYSVALALAIRQGRWAAARMVVIATLVFNLASLYACALEIIQGTATGMVYMIMIASILLVAITGWILYEHRGISKANHDLPSAGTALIVVATLSALAFGVLGLFLPVETAHLFGYKGTDVFVYRQAGAASLGYAIMGVYMMRSLNWSELRVPTLMAIVFNGFSLLAAILAILTGDPIVLPLVITVATLGITTLLILTYIRKERG